MPYSSLIEKIKEVILFFIDVKVDYTIILDKIYLKFSLIL